MNMPREWWNCYFSCISENYLLQVLCWSASDKYPQHVFVEKYEKEQQQQLDTALI